MNHKAFGTTLLVFCAMLFALPAFASETNGTIDADHHRAWGENIGWIDFAPEHNGTYSGLRITDSAVTGYAWIKNFGWVNFIHVENTPDGELSGRAWIATLGWLDMSGVTINSSGKFTGTAGSDENAIGRISFDCDNCTVMTDWRPISARTATPTVAGTATFAGTDGQDQGGADNDVGGNENGESNAGNGSNSAGTSSAAGTITNNPETDANNLDAKTKKPSAKRAATTAAAGIAGAGGIWAIWRLRWRGFGGGKG